MLHSFRTVNRGEPAVVRRSLEPPVKETVHFRIDDESLDGIPPRPGNLRVEQARNTSLGEAGIIRCSVITSVLGLAGDVVASSPVLPLSVLFLEVALEFVELRVPEPRIFVHPVRDFSQRLGAKRDQHFTAVPLALDEYTENSRLLVVSVL